MKYLPNCFQMKVTCAIKEREFIKLRALSFTKGPGISSQILKRLFQKRVNKVVPNTLHYLEVSNRVKRIYDKEKKMNVDHYDVMLCINARPCDIFTSKFFGLFHFG